MEIRVSTGGFHDLPPNEVVRDFLKSGIQAIELSGGKWVPQGLDAFRGFLNSANLSIHNYFPVPKDPFVLNLASEDPQVARRSIDHVKNALRWSEQLGGNIYSFHAGFLFDPLPAELGKQIPSRSISDRRPALSRFISHVELLAVEAQSLGIRLLVENNVLTQANFQAFGDNPFLMVDAAECEYVIDALGGKAGLLMDVGHAHVSSCTLGFSASDMIHRCNKLIEGLHLSSNDGTADTNSPISSSDWYWAALKRKIEYVAIEVYGLEAKELRAQQLLAASLMDKLPG